MDPQREFIAQNWRHPGRLENCTEIHLSDLLRLSRLTFAHGSGVTVTRSLLPTGLTYPVSSVLAIRLSARSSWRLGVRHRSWGLESTPGPSYLAPRLATMNRIAATRDYTAWDVHLQEDSHDSCAELADAAVPHRQLRISVSTRWRRCYHSNGSIQCPTLGCQIERNTWKSPNQQRPKPRHWTAQPIGSENPSRSSKRSVMLRSQPFVHVLQRIQFFAVKHGLPLDRHLLVAIRECPLAGSRVLASIRKPTTG